MSGHNSVSDWYDKKFSFFSWKSKFNRMFLLTPVLSGRPTCWSPTCPGCCSRRRRQRRARWEKISLWPRSRDLDTCLWLAGCRSSCLAPAPAAEPPSERAPLTPAPRRGHNTWPVITHEREYTNIHPKSGSNVGLLNTVTGITSVLNHVSDCTNLYKLSYPLIPP